MMTLQVRNMELNEYFMKLSQLVICLLFILKVFDSQVSKRTQRSHFLKIGVVSCSEPNDHERERERERETERERQSNRNPRAQLLQRARLVRVNTRVGTLIVATIYLQLIQNRYMFRSFTVLQCSHQHCVQPIASDVEVLGYLQQRLLC